MLNGFKFEVWHKHFLNGYPAMLKSIAVILHVIVIVIGIYKVIVSEGKNV